MTSSPHYLSAQEAAAELGISLATLYSYVSRGLIRSEEAGGPRRRRRYRAEDVQRLKERKELRRDPSRAVEKALDWGAPLLESAITLIQDGRFFYRGRDALALADSHTIEQVAALIWLEEEAAPDAPALPELFRATQVTPLLAQLADARAAWPPLGLVEAFQAILPLAGALDPSAYDLRPQPVARTGARILHLLAATAVGQDGLSASIAETLQRRWVPQDAGAARLLDGALILCADHELNVSSFTARCVASAGSTPYAVVQAGLAALRGVRHGGYTERVEALLDQVGMPGQAEEVLAARLKRGEPIPGFGHRLYPGGDPRAGWLLARAAEARPGSPAVALAQAVTQAAQALLGEHPTLDFGLVTLARALDLPPGAPLALFALGRTVGWIGHALEQYRSQQLIRPRARYVGVLPPEADPAAS